LNLTCDNLLSKVSFNRNLRPYNEEFPKDWFEGLGEKTYRSRRYNRGKAVQVDPALTPD